MARILMPLILVSLVVAQSGCSLPGVCYQYAPSCCPSACAVQSCQEGGMENARKAAVNGPRPPAPPRIADRPASPEA